MRTAISLVAGSGVAIVLPHLHFQQHPFLYFVVGLSCMVMEIRQRGTGDWSAGSSCRKGNAICFREKNSVISVFLVAGVLVEFGSVDHDCLHKVLKDRRKTDKEIFE